MVNTRSTAGSLTPSSEPGSPFAPAVHYTNGNTPTQPAEMVELLDKKVLADGYVSVPVPAPASLNETHQRNRNEYSPAQDDLLSVARHWEARIERFLQNQFADGDVLTHTQEQVRISLGVVEEALKRWRMYNLRYPEPWLIGMETEGSHRFDELAISFNGGKDCLVMLIIFLAGLSRWFSDQQKQSSSPPSPSVSASPISPSTRAPIVVAPSGTKPRCPLVTSLRPTSISCVYVMSTHPFPEVDQFVADCVHTYHLTVHRYPVPLKSAFSTFLSVHPLVQVIFVGTRRTDPHGANLGFFNPTDGGWPGFVRCQPVIDWHYKEIWAFLRYFDIPYCSLYDQGYTSLGGTIDTNPNPKLAILNSGCGPSTVGKPVYQLSSGPAAMKIKFRPAYELMNDEEERLGRH